MNLKTASFLLLLLSLIGAVFTADYWYELKYSNQPRVSNADAPIPVSNTESKQVKNSAKSTINAVKLAPKLSQNTPPHFSVGFDWGLPANTKITDYSGLITENRLNPKVINNRFIRVRWDKSNPRPGEFNFTKLAKKLKRIAPQRALIRLEVNSSCEAPRWALDRLKQSKHKSLIYWDKAYQDLTRPFIQTFAKQFASNPQIIGVQLGLADGEFGEAADSCNNYSNKNGWGEFWMSPSERQEAETQFGFNPEVFLKSSLENIDVYANAFGTYKNKLAFTNIGPLFTYGEGAKPYNRNLKTIVKYVLDNGLGNRDGAIERWMSYTDKVYGSVFTSMPDGSCRLDVNEHYMRNLKGRYWGTENEFYGNKNYVIADMGPVKNHPYIFLISSLRALQMRRNFISLTDMSAITHPEYKIQDFIQYLTLTLGKQFENTSDAFVLMGERYIAPYRLKDHIDADCVRNNKQAVKVRSFGRWLSESSQNSHVENNAAIKVTMPAAENYWYQGYYLPEGIDYEYFAREAKTFSFDLNDQLSQYRCLNTCDVEVKATFKDTVKTRLSIQVAEGMSQSLQTSGDDKIKTANFTISSKFMNKLDASDLSLISDKQAIPLILLRINFNK